MPAQRMRSEGEIVSSQLLLRRVVAQVGIAAVDLRILRPDFRVESGRQAGFQLRVGKPGDARAIAAAAALRLAGGIDVPMGVLRVIASDPANKAPARGDLAGAIRRRYGNVP